MKPERLKIFTASLSSFEGQENLENEVTEWMDNDTMRIVSRYVDTDYVVDPSEEVTHFHKITITIFYLEL